MSLRSLRLLPATLCLGCAVLTGQAPEAPPEGPPVRVAEKKSADEDALLLKEAARRLDDGDDAAALPYLARYVAAHPEHVTIRAHLAELLLKLKKPDEAREQLERYVADAQAQGEPAAKHLVHCHTRLVEIAVEQGDAYAEHLNRGLGLFRLGERLVMREGGEDDPQVQKVLFQAIAELKLAATERPEEPRPNWYLHECWSHLGQSQPAREHLARARKLAALGGLTSAEECQMRNAEIGTRN
jgi:predicted Zn-dependent protease